MVVMFTTNPIYWSPLVPRITITSTSGATNYYTYDPWTDSGTTTKTIGCNVQLSQNHQGTFSIQIEDQTDLINSNVNLGARVLIECGKQSTQMTRLISGLIRQKGYSRGGDRKRIITLSGSSTSIRLNEKILYYVNEAAKLASDGITIDINDTTRKADALLQAGLVSLTNEGIINAGNVATSSDVENFIASLAIEFGEAQDLCNTLEEQSNGEIFVDPLNIVQFRHQLQPLTAGRGFTIKNKNAATDNADDTCYLRGKSWEYTESSFKSDGYSNRIWGILPAETPPSSTAECGLNFGATSGGEFAIIQSGATENAYKFRPPHSHWFAGDIYIVGIYCAATAVLPWTVRFRICQDSGGLPQNAGGIVANIDFPGSAEVFGKTLNNPATHTDEGWRVSNEQIFYNPSNVKIDSFDLDTTKDYWLIISNDNIPTGNSPTPAFTWPVQRDTTGCTGAFGGLSTNSAGGTGWAVFDPPGSIRMPCVALPRVRAEAFECSDHKAVKFMGSGLATTGGNFIESSLSGIPSTIKTREAMQRYMVNQLYYMARPRVNWNMATVTAPNIPIIPGDPILISDTVMGFSASGGQAVMATCGDMTYSWQIGQYQAPTILSIQPVTNPTHYNN